jgi:transposase
MSAPRRPLANIDTNRQLKNELSRYTRGVIEALNLNGNLIRLITEKLQIPPLMIQYTLEQTTRRTNGETRSRDSRPRKLNARTMTLIIRIIRQNPFICYREIRDQIPVPVSDRILLRTIKESGYGHKRAKRRPKLLKKHATARLEWCLEREDWTVE